MAVSSSWLVGSFNLAANATVTVNATNKTVLAGDYYLRDATAGLSLIAALQTEIAAVVAGSTVYIGQDRKVRIDFNGNATTIAIASTLRAVLGFTQASYGPVTSVTAENVSPLLWSPGWPETTKGSPVGVTGHKVYDRIMTSSPTGLTFDVTLHHSTTMVEWSWFAVRQDRAWTTTGADGEYVVFFDEVIVAGYRFKLYSNVTEDDASSTAVTWPTALGPYVVPEPDYEWYQRFVPNSDSLGANISIEAMLTSEYT